MISDLIVKTHLMLLEETLKSDTYFNCENTLSNENKAEFKRILKEEFITAF